MSTFKNFKRALQLTNQPYAGVHLKTGFVGVKGTNDQFDHPKIIKGKANWKTVLGCTVSKANDLLGNSNLMFLATDSNVAKEIAINMQVGRFKN